MHDYWVVNKTAVAKALEKFSDKEQDDLKKMANEFKKLLNEEDAKADDS